jgi:hypothetical protein
MLIAETRIQISPIKLLGPPRVRATTAPWFKELDYQYLNCKVPETPRYIT